ncbi:MAG: restriction endonuclease subunit S [Actinomycetota bacterium]|nr:restriction endonuclease subunit S [Actinomycetota bacterium]
MTLTVFSTAAFPLTTVGKVAEVRLGKMLQPEPAAASDVEVPYLRAGSLDDLMGEAALKTMWASKAERASYRVRRGDLIVAEGGDVGRSAFVPKVPHDTIIQNSLHWVRPHAGDVRFLKYTLDAIYASGWLDVLCNKATFGHLTWEKLAALIIPWPPQARQRAIADFLDAETTRIDSLIDKKLRMIHLLAQRYWSWVSDRIRRTAAHTAPLRRALASITDGPFGSSLTSAHYSDDGARVVRLGNIGMAEFKNDDEAYIPPEHYATLLKHRVNVGDLLVAGLGDATNHVGRGCVAPELGPAIVKADCYCATVDGRVASVYFLALYLSSPLGRDAVASLTRGSTRTRINLDIAKSIPVVLPR